MHADVRLHTFRRLFVLMTGALTKLLDLGASPDYRNGAGLTPLYMTCMHGGPGSLRCTEALLKDQAQVGVRDKNNWTELHHAAKLGFDGHIEALGLYGADTEARNAAGNSPFHVAAAWDQPGSAEALMAHGAELGCTNSAGQTPHQVAALAGAQLVVDLLNKGISPRPRSRGAGDTGPAYIQRSRSGSIHAIRPLASRGARTAEEEARQALAPAGDSMPFAAPTHLPGGGVAATTPPRVGAAEPSTRRRWRR